MVVMKNFIIVILLCVIGIGIEYIYIQHKAQEVAKEYLKQELDSVYRVPTYNSFDRERQINNTLNVLDAYVGNKDK